MFRSVRLAVFALQVLGGLAASAPAKEDLSLNPFRAGIAPAPPSFPPIPVDESVEKDENGIVLCPMKVDTCIAAAKEQEAAMKEAKKAHNRFKHASKNMKEAKREMKAAKKRMQRAKDAGDGKGMVAAGKAQKAAGKRMVFWGKRMEVLGAELGKAKWKWGDANRVANIEATNEAKTVNKEHRHEKADERAAKKAAREACEGNLNPDGSCDHPVPAGGDANHPAPATTTPSHCADGFKSGNEQYCCAASCGKCGGKGCSGLPGGNAACCMTGISVAGKTCSFPSDTACVMPGVTAGNVKAMRRRAASGEEA